MSNSNGTTPPEGVSLEPAPTTLGPLTNKSDRELLEMAVRQSHHAWETASGALVWVQELAKSQDRRFGALERRLGIVEAAPRDGSHPALDRIVGLHLDEEETEVRRRRLDLEAAEAERKAAAANKAKAYAFVWLVAWRVVLPLLVGLGGAVATRSCIGG
jgi:hypothetical protein